MLCFHPFIIQIFAVRFVLYVEKEMATHSSILAWRISWTEEPGELYTGRGITKRLDTTNENVTTFKIK